MMRRQSNRGLSPAQAPQPEELLRLDAATAKAPANKFRLGCRLLKMPRSSAFYRRDGTNAAAWEAVRRSRQKRDRYDAAQCRTGIGQPPCGKNGETSSWHSKAAASKHDGCIRQKVRPRHRQRG